MAVCDTALLPQLEALRSLRLLVSKTAQKLNALNIPLPVPSSLPESAYRNEAIRSLSLPQPDDILTPILEAEVPEDLRRGVRKCFIAVLSDVQQKCLDNYRQTSTFLLQRGPPVPNFENLRKAYLDFYMRQCHILVQTHLPNVMKGVAEVVRQPPRHGTTKTEFNQEFVPILERYFAHNAYPSLPDRLLLARKSMMTPRQIEVWFQNHRNRAKKDGVQLRRLSPKAASTFAFDKPAPSSSSPPPPDPEVAVSVSERSCSVDTNQGPVHDESISFQQERSDFSNYRPPHAFPTPYSARPANDPFLKDDTLFKETSRFWMRLPAAATKKRPSISIDELAHKFSLLHLRVSAFRSKPSARRPKWVSPMLVVPPAAPHPSVINPSYASRHSSRPVVAPCHWQQPSLCVRTTVSSRSRASYPSWALRHAPPPRSQKSPHIPSRRPSSFDNARNIGNASRSTSSSSTSSSFSSSSLSSSTSSSSLYSSSTSSSSSSSLFSSTSSLSSASSMTSFASPSTSQTAVEPWETSSMEKVFDPTEPSSFDTMWYFEASNDAQYQPLPEPQYGAPPMSQDWALTDFGTLDLPTFEFFDS